MFGVNVLASFSVFFFFFVSRLLKKQKEKEGVAAILGFIILTSFFKHFFENNKHVQDNLDRALIGSSRCAHSQTLERVHSQKTR